VGQYPSANRTIGRLATENGECSKPTASRASVFAGKSIAGEYSFFYVIKATKNKEILQPNVFFRTTASGVLTNGELQGHI
jgi:hypothetical protein